MFRYKILSLLITSWLFLSSASSISQAASPATPLHQSSTPFLSTPYYGTKSINSYFDHEYPNYGTNGSIVIYTGARRSPASSQNCTLGFSCYDGHDGYDFNMVYERVLAAADGVVTVAGWHIPNCHDPVQNPTTNCGYGLYIEINHPNGYTTRYGHLSAVTVRLGQQVYAGQIIGTSGNTGNSSGPHLHFGVLYNVTIPIDPFGWSGQGTDPWRTASGVTSYFLRSTGQFASPSRPIPMPLDSLTTIVDDGDTGFEKGNYSGPCPPGYCPKWNYFTGAGINNDMWWVGINFDIDYYARWQPTLSLGGFYEVWVYIPSNNATSWQARYSIASLSGYNEAVVDQLGTSNRWLCLGLYRFNAGSNPSGAVSVTDYTYEVDLTRHLGVDAVKFVARQPVYIPFIQNGSPPLYRPYP